MIKREIIDRYFDLYRPIQEAETAILQAQEQLEAAERVLKEASESLTAFASSLPSHVTNALEVLARNCEAETTVPDVVGNDSAEVEEIEETEEKQENPISVRSLGKRPIGSHIGKHMPANRTRRDRWNVIYEMHFNKRTAIKHIAKTVGMQIDSVRYTIARMGDFSELPETSKAMRANAIYNNDAHGVWTPGMPLPVGRGAHRLPSSRASGEGAMSFASMSE